MKKLVLSFMLLVCHVLNMSAYDFYSKTKYSVEEALDSVNLYYSINPDRKTVSVTVGPENYSFKHIRIPETVAHNDTAYTVTEIAPNAFSGGNINIVEMANTITMIGDRAFYSCGIDSIKFSENLKSIGKNAFSGSDLTAVYLPEGLETIESAAFAGNTNYYGQPMGKIRFISLPSSLSEIGERAFASNSPLNNVVIPDKITEIKKGAFGGCWNLNDVTLPKNLTKIGDSAFDGCGFVELKKEFFPETLIEIGSSAFSYSIHGGTALLKKVVLPDNIKSIGVSCFQGQSSLESITFSSGMTELPKNVCSSCKKLVDVVIHNGITKIGDYAFNSTTLLSHIDLPSSVTEIGTESFSHSGLVSFTFPQNVETIGWRCFRDCTYLKEVIFSDNLKSIMTEAFYGCKSLEKISLPESVETIEGTAFYNCEKLEEVNMEGSSLKTIGTNAFSGCVSLKNVILSDSLQKIDQLAFANCTSLENVEMPRSLETLGERAFYGCSSLTNITILHNVSSWGKECFYGCSSLKEVHYKRAVLPSLSSSLRLVEDNNQCTLYVPIGSKESYEASSNWNNFSAIVEEEIGYDILYRVSVAKTGQGVVTVNESNMANTDIISGSSVKISIVPKEGWKIGSVTVDGVDASAECEDGEYEIEALGKNVSIVVSFDELPAILQLKQGEGGAINMPVKKGTQFSCEFIVEEGWKINNVMFNGVDVTYDVVDGSKYVTPTINRDATLTVAFEKPGESSVQLLENESKVKAYVLNDGTLVVVDAENAEPINVVTSEGKVVATLISQEGRAVYQLKEHGVYLVNTIGKTIKVAY